MSTIKFTKIQLRQCPHLNAINRQMSLRTARTNAFANTLPSRLLVIHRAHQSDFIFAGKVNKVTFRVSSYSVKMLNTQQYFVVFQTSWFLH